MRFPPGSCTLRLCMFPASYLRVPFGFPTSGLRITCGFPRGFQRVSCGFPMDSRMLPTRYLRVTCKFPADVVRVPREFPADSLRVSYENYLGPRFPMRVLKVSCAVLSPFCKISYRHRARYFAFSARYKWHFLSALYGCSTLFVDEPQHANRVMQIKLCTPPPCSRLVP